MSTVKNSSVDITCNIAQFNKSPIAVGGVGGSGTRVVAEMLKELGIFMGVNVNVANDNLGFVKSRTLLTEETDEATIYAEFQKFESTMHNDFLTQHHYSRNWGWKVPGQFHLLKYTSKYFPELKYIHVIRNGLDMAFSNNKNQLKNWGPYLGIEASDPDDPAAALAYWISANNIAINEGSTLLGERFLLLNFDDLCLNPESVLNHLIAFITDTKLVDLEKQNSLASLVKPPKSINRYKLHDYQNLFSKEAIDAVKRLGFSV